MLAHLQRSYCRAASLPSLAVTRHFCSAKVLVRVLRWSEASLPCSIASPCEEKFPEEICSSPEQDRKSAARHLDCAKTFQTGTASNREREYSDISGHARLVLHRKPRTPRESEGPRPFSREGILKGNPGVSLARLLSFAKRFLSCTSKKENALGPAGRLLPEPKRRLPPRTADTNSVSSGKVLPLWATARQ